jgi:hypothetical protein
MPYRPGGIGQGFIPTVDSSKASGMGEETEEAIGEVRAWLVAPTESLTAVASGKSLKLLECPLPWHKKFTPHPFHCFL